MNCLTGGIIEMYETTITKIPNEPTTPITPGIADVTQLRQERRGCDGGAKSYPTRKSKAWNDRLVDRRSVRHVRLPGPSELPARADRRILFRHECEGWRQPSYLR